MNNKVKMLELVISVLPYPNQIKNINLDEEDAIRFDWRGTRYRVATTCYLVEEVDNGILSGTSSSILMQKLLKDTAWLKI